MTNDDHGRFSDPLMPFAWEIIWFSAGSLAFYIDGAVSLAGIGILLFGGLFGGWAYNRNVERGGDG